MRRYIMALAFGAIFGAGQSSAATVNVDLVNAGWGTVVAASSKSMGGGGGTAHLKWGKPINKKKSGYDFVGLTSIGNDVGEEFQLGTFTHKNNPIVSGTSITEATLSISVDLMIDGLKKQVTSKFKFAHNETANRKVGKTCANGNKFGVGVNLNGCADQVTFASVLDMLEEFQIGNAIYTLQIKGFLLGGVTVSDFWTMEKAANSAVLMAQFIKVRDLPPPPTPTPVPLPASGLLLLASLAGLAAARRRRG
jgi:hypothetical protein